MFSILQCFVGSVFANGAKHLKNSTTLKNCSEVARIWKQKNYINKEQITYFRIIFACKKLNLRQKVFSRSPEKFKFA